MGKKGIKKRTRRLRKFDIGFYESWRDVLMKYIKMEKINEDVKMGIIDVLEWIEFKEKEIMKQTRLF